jgi:hypothetical protein
MAFMDLGKIRFYEEMSFSFKAKSYLIKLCSYDSKEGFNHKGELYEVLIHDIFKDNILVAKKINNYFNRTWERFTFESVILGVFKKAFRDDYILAFNNLMEVSRHGSSFKKDLEKGSLI